MTWSHDYAPLGSLMLSAAVATLPVVTLLGLLAFWHVRAQIAALAGLVVAVALALTVYHMPPRLAAAAVAYGAAFGLFPIGWIILNAMFIYNLSVRTGQFAVLQRQVAGVSRDRRIQALLIAFGFGAFIEGAAGFGAPVAITGALMIGLGFRPLEAARLALIGNTAPVAFGALGTPLITLARVTGLDVESLSSMVGRQLPLFSLLVPFWLVAAQSGWRGMVEVWPACLVSGLSFGVLQYAVSNFHGPWLVDIVAAVGSMGSLVLFLRMWSPRTIQGNPVPATERAESPSANSGTWRAWIPWVFLTVFVFLWGLPAVKTSLNGLMSPAFEVPWLHKAVLRMPPVVPKPEAEAAVFSLNLLSATGTALLFAGVLAGLALGMRPGAVLRTYGQTLWSLRVSLLTIALMLALGFTTRYSGTDTTLGLAMAGTGFLFPFFSPLIGWLGVALTGSDTSSNVLFGNLQQVTAQQLHLPPVLMAASNSSGGVMGKMIDAQSIVVASVATGGHPESPDAGTVLRAVFWHSVALAVLMGLLVMVQAYVLPGWVPGK
ncbi:MAG: L-lactate permease [Verrucomicrobiales bacterium]|nr:L-lactate permease [Verrucomicrobiales bacterium]